MIAAYQEARHSLLTGLDEESQIVAEAAIRLFERFIVPRQYSGGCYLTTMVLHRYLLDERGIITEPVVGYINDGTDDIFMSHAWIEHRGRKTDVTIALTDPDLGVRPGPLLAQDAVLLPGHSGYSYHLELSDDAIAQNRLFMAEPQTAELLQHKEREHRHMAECMRDAERMRDHMAGAPPEFSYAAMRFVLE